MITIPYFRTTNQSGSPTTISISFGSATFASLYTGTGGNGLYFSVGLGFVQAFNRIYVQLKDNTLNFYADLSNSIPSGTPYEFPGTTITYVI